MLDLATIVRIAAEFSPAEQDRTRAAAARDRRLQIALSVADYGLTQTPAAGLLRERGDLDGLRALVDTGDPEAADQLAGLMTEQGRSEEAMRLRQFGGSGALGGEKLRSEIQTPAVHLGQAFSVASMLLGDARHEHLPPPIGLFREFCDGSR